MGVCVGGGNGRTFSWKRKPSNCVTSGAELRLCPGATSHYLDCPSRGGISIPFHSETDFLGHVERVILVPEDWSLK